MIFDFTHGSPFAEMDIKPDTIDVQNNIHNWINDSLTLPA
jgi:hypothetical protein